MSPRKRLIIWLASAAAVATLSFFLIYTNVAHSVNTSAASDKTEETVEEDIEENNNTGVEIEENTESVQTPDEEKEEVEEVITGVTDERPYNKKLVEEDSKNILVVGEDKNNNLYDTMMIISISKKTKTVKIIQIPRDTYVKYNKKTLSFMKSEGLIDLPGTFKINYSHDIGIRMKYEKNVGRFGSWTSMNFLSDVIEEKLGISVNDFVKVNTESFVEVVNLFGGVDIYVPYDMNYDDPDQDLSIHLEKGMQHLSGTQAEGFVRYRKGYDRDGNYHEYGDYERKKNQLAFMNGFIEQHGTIGNIDKIPGLIKSVNLKHSIGFGDVLFTYMGIAKDVITDNYEIESTILEGKAKMINGSSYIVIEGEE